MATGLGIITYNRPKNLSIILDSLRNPVMKELYDHLVIVNDGSDKNAYASIYESLLEEDNVAVIHLEQNKGVAAAKNSCLKELMRAQCDFFFLLEDDLIPQDPRCIEAYIAAYRTTGYEHFNYAHHGPVNEGGPIDESNGVQYYAGCVGAWSFYTRNVIETVGYLDEEFYNAVDHMEHTWRIAKAGLTSPFWKFADVSDSRDWFEEIGELKHSVIRQQKNWLQNTENAKLYWRSKDENCPI